MDVSEVRLTRLFDEPESASQAETAVRSLNGKLFAGRALTVGWATPVRQSA